MSEFQSLTTTPPENPNSVYTAGYSNVILYNVTNASQCHAIPADFIGSFVSIRAEGATVTFLFGIDSTLVVDNTITSTATGARSASLGRPLVDTQECDVYLTEGCKYIARQGSGNGSLRIIQSSTKSVKVLP